MNQIAQFDPQDLEKALTLPSYTARLQQMIAPDGTEYREGTPITDQHRADLILRADRIEACLQDSRPNRSTALVSMLLTSFPSRDLGDETAAIKVAAYVMALDDQPGWAIEKTVRRYILGDVGDKVFAPTPPQMREAVMNTVLAAKGRASWLRSLAKLPVASIKTPEEKARVQAVVDGAKLKSLQEAIKPSRDHMRRRAAAMRAEADRIEADSAKPIADPQTLTEATPSQASGVAA